MRVLCLYFPRIAIEVATEGRPELAERPVVTLQGSGDTALVVSASAQAAAAGVVPGMSAAEARRRCPGAVFLADTSPECFERMERIASIIRVRATPLVAVGGPDHLFIDLAGTEALFGREETAAGRLGQLAETWLRLPVRAGVASSREEALGAARAARFRPIVVPQQVADGADRPISSYSEQSIAVEGTIRGGREETELARMLRGAQAVLEGRSEGFREARFTIESEAGAIDARLHGLRYETRELAAWIRDHLGTLEPGREAWVRLELRRLCADARVRPVAGRRARPAGLIRAGRQFPLRAAG
ncbi:MAG TPA: hypothetical protein VIH05_03535 [Tepidiformaceae bacterium]